MEKSYYYRKDTSERLGPWPADGKWPSIYGARGFTLEPPADFVEPVEEIDLAEEIEATKNEGRRRKKGES